MIALTGAIQVALLLPILLFATFEFGLYGKAWAVLVHGVALALPIAYWIVCRTTPIRIGDVFEVCLRPVVTCVAMYGAVQVLLPSLQPLSNFTHSMGALLAACVLGTTVYVFSTFALWLLVKRPEGAESTLIARVKPILNRLSTGTQRPD